MANLVAPRITRRTPIVDLPELLRVEEVAAWCDCGRGTVYEAVRCGSLAHVRLGRLLRIPRQAIEAWLRTAERRAS